MLATNVLHSCCGVPLGFVFTAIQLMYMDLGLRSSKRLHMDWKQKLKVLDEAYEKGFGIKLREI